MIPTRKIDIQRAVAGGAVAGTAAGLGLTLMMTVMSAAAGKDIWYGMKGSAAPLLGERAMQAGFDLPAVILGLAIHMAISIGWAVAFALLFFQLRRVTTLLAGFAWGFVVWIGMYYVVLPLVGLEGMTKEAPIGRVIMFHEIFSILMAAAFLAYERIEGRSAPRSPGAPHRPRTKPAFA